MGGGVRGWRGQSRGNEGRGVNKGGRHSKGSDEGRGGDGGEMKRDGECGVCGGLLVRRHVESGVIEK